MIDFGVMEELKANGCKQKIVGVYISCPCYINVRAYPQDYFPVKQQKGGPFREEGVSVK